MSGGAVWFQGQLVGLISARDADKNLCYCVPIDDIWRCLGKTVTAAPRPEYSSARQRELSSYLLGGRTNSPYLEQHAETVENTPIVVQGMAGVGKSWLVERFRQRQQHVFTGGHITLALDIHRNIAARAYWLMWRKNWRLLFHKSNVRMLFEMPFSTSNAVTH